MHGPNPRAPDEDRNFTNTPASCWDRAEEVQALLARRAMHHRSATIADLIIAAAAEHHGCTVLHYDSDYDVIAAVTGQPMEWAAKPGTIT